MRAGIWQPIETAPTDETDVLVYGNGSCLVAYRYKGSEEWLSCCDSSWGDILGADNQPTHWMPLPDPPETKKGNP